MAPGKLRSHERDLRSPPSRHQCGRREQAAELEAVLDANPFVDRGSNPKALHVMFLSDHPSDERVAALDPQRSPPDEFAVLGREVYLHCPKGIARSKLTTAWIDRALGTVATVRNWNTVNALVERCRAS